MSSARALREAGMEAARSQAREIDLAGVDGVDSSALGVLLAWQRAASGRGLRLRIGSAPAALASLAGLYRLEALLDEAA